MLDRKTILEANDRPVETVDVPEWGGQVLVKTMSARERDAFEHTITEQKGRKYESNLDNLRAKLCIWCVVDEEGTRLFGDRDADLLGEKSAAALDRVFAVAQRLNGISAEDVDEMAKNSESGQPENSVSS